ncbi:MAG: hypothetical protein JO076_13430 [Verrucomicrobia bacterium]|nr:hypothetical protein [Verrucomicrobiota bacterium]
MAANENTSFFQLAGPDDNVLFFSGPPQTITGIIPVVNISSEDQKIRSITIKSNKLRGAGGVPLSEIPFRARLRGGQQANLRARLPVDPLTPPGSYEFEVTIGSRKLPAVAHIPEVIDLRILPGEITIVASPKTSSYTRSVVAENRGNVSLLTGNQCEVPVFEITTLTSAVLNGLSKGDRESKDSMVKAALTELADLKVGTLVIKRKAMAISPGQKVAVDIEFELPAELKPQRRYSASLSLYNANLKIEIYTTAKSQLGSRKQK